MANSLAAQLATLTRERERLEQFLMLDANWRALQALGPAAAALADGGGDAAVGGEARLERSRLEAALSTNRIYAARAKIVEVIELLTAEPPPGGVRAPQRPPLEQDQQPQSGALAGRIVMLEGPGIATFKTRLKAKGAPAGPVEPAPEPAQEPGSAPLAPAIVTSAVAEPALTGSLAGAEPAGAPTLLQVAVGEAEAGVDGDNNDDVADASATIMNDVPSSHVAAPLTTHVPVVQAADPIEPPVEPSPSPSPSPNSSQDPETVGNQAGQNAITPTVQPAAEVLQPDRLDLIKGFGADAVERLHGAGITSFDAIARWTRGDVSVWRWRLGRLADGPAGSWIEQAAMLAQGCETSYASRVRRGEVEALVPAPPAEPPRTVPAVAAIAAANDEASEAASEAASDPASEPDTPSHPLATAPSPPDHEEAVIEGEALQAVPVAQPDVLLPPEAAIAPDREPSPAPLPPTSPPPTNSLPPLLSEGVDGGARMPSLPLSASGLDDAEVVIVARREPRRPSMPPPPPKPAARSSNATLTRRLASAHEPETFDADTYAAYRGEVEEATVTIIRRGEASPLDTSPPPPPEAEERGVSVNRFVRALKGKD